MKSTASQKKLYLLQHGLELVSQIGLTAITLGNLAEKAEVSKSGLFAHFGSKEELQIALLEHSANIASQVVILPSLTEPEGLPRLQSLIQNWFGWPSRAELPGGCPVAAAMFELDDVENPVKEKVAALNTEWQAYISQLVKEACHLGHLDPKLDVNQFVWQLFGIYLVHHVFQRFERDPDVNVKATRAVDALIDHSKPK